MQTKIDAQEHLRFHVDKDITILYKQVLTLLEDVRNQHLFMLEKLEKELPKEYHPVLRAANYLDDTEFGYLRKKVLDAGNDAKRNVATELKQFEVNFLT